MAGTSICSFGAVVREGRSFRGLDGRGWKVLSERRGAARRLYHQPGIMRGSSEAVCSAETKFEVAERPATLLVWRGANWRQVVNVIDRKVPTQRT